jgi:hypothetical protein
MISSPAFATVELFSNRYHFFKKMISIPAHCGVGGGEPKNKMISIPAAADSTRFTGCCGGCGGHGGVAVPLVW